MLKDKEHERKVFQMYNNNLKNILRLNKYEELTPGKYFENKETDAKNGLSVLQGYKFTLANLKGKVCLQVDVCTRVFRSNNLLEEIQRLQSHDQVN